MDWDDLRYVLALSREHSLSRAAVQLNTTHTTVGRRLHTIEEKLGVRLFDQTPDGFIPTSAGIDIAQVAEKMENEIHSLEARVLGRDERLQGTLRISTMDILFHKYQGAIASFMARYPNVDVTLLVSDSRVSLNRREADVAIRLTNAPPEHLVGRKIGRADFAVYSSKELVNRIGAQASLEDFPWIHWDERLNMRWLDDFLTQRAPKAKIAVRVDCVSQVLIEVVAAGIGVHFLPCFIADRDPRLQRLGSIETQFSTDLWLLTLADLRNTNRIRAFMDYMEQHILSEKRL